MSSVCLSRVRYSTHQFINLLLIQIKSNFILGPNLMFIKSSLLSIFFLIEERSYFIHFLKSKLFSLASNSNKPFQLLLVFRKSIILIVYKIFEDRKYYDLDKNKFYKETTFRGQDNVLIWLKVFPFYISWISYKQTFNWKSKW